MEINISLNLRNDKHVRENAAEIWAAARLRSLLTVLLINVGVLFVIVVVLEGVASCLYSIRQLPRAHVNLAERRHTSYDSDLGWINRPSIYIPDMYGAGVYLRTNSQGFRNNRDFQKRVPQGKFRIIASGDSFTMGYGVDNDHTWGERLASVDPRLEVVNMGQGGYGFDQAYLRYKRDAVAVDHQVHLMAFISDDLDRMRFSTFEGYGKPTLDLQGDALVVRNVPVAHYSRLFGVFNRNLRAGVGNLRSVELALSVSRWSGLPGVAGIVSDRTESHSRLRRVQRQMLVDLKRLNEERGSKLILVYLPVLPEVQSMTRSADTLELLDVAHSLDIPVIDLFGSFAALSSSTLARMFIPNGKLDYFDAGGHFTEVGNELAASAIYGNLKNILPAGQFIMAFP